MQQVVVVFMVVMVKCVSEPHSFALKEHPIYRMHRRANFKIKPEKDHYVNYMIV